MSKASLLINVLRLLPNTWKSMLNEAEVLEQALINSGQRTEQQSVLLQVKLNDFERELIRQITTLCEKLPQSRLYQNLASKVLDWSIVTDWQLAAEFDATSSQQVAVLVDQKIAGLTPWLTGLFGEDNPKVTDSLTHLKGILSALFTLPKTIDFGDVSALLAYKAQAVEELMPSAIALVNVVFSVQLPVINDSSVFNTWTDKAAELANTACSNNFNDCFTNGFTEDLAALQQQLADLPTGEQQGMAGSKRQLDELVTALIASHEEVMLAEEVQLFPDTWRGDSSLTAIQAWSEVLPKAVAHQPSYVQSSLAPVLATIAKVDEQIDQQSQLKTVIVNIAHNYQTTMDLEQKTKFIFDSLAQLLPLLSLLELSEGLEANIQTIVGQLAYKAEDDLSDEIAISLFILAKLAPNVEQLLPASINSALGDNGLQKLLNKVIAVRHFIKTQLSVRGKILNENDINNLFSQAVDFTKQSAEQVEFSSSASLDHGTKPLKDNSGTQSQRGQSEKHPPEGQNITAVSTNTPTLTQWLAVIAQLVSYSEIFEQLSAHEQAMMQAMLTGQMANYCQRELNLLTDGLLAELGSVAETVLFNDSLAQATLSEFVDRFLAALPELATRIQGFLLKLSAMVSDFISLLIKCVQYIKIPADIASSWPLNMMLDNKNPNLFCLFTVMPLSLIKEFCQLPFDDIKKLFNAA